MVDGEKKGKCEPVDGFYETGTKVPGKCNEICATCSSKDDCTACNG